jgi:hypothetical protein
LPRPIDVAVVGLHLQIVDCLTRKKLGLGGHSRTLAQASLYWMRGRAEKAHMTCLMVGIILLLLPGSQRASAASAPQNGQSVSPGSGPLMPAPPGVGSKLDRAFRIAFNALGVSLVLVGVLQSWA